MSKTTKTPASVGNRPPHPSVARKAAPQTAGAKATETQPIASQSADAPPTAPYTGLAFRTATIATRKPTRFDFRPSGPQRAAMAAELDLLKLPMLRFKGEIRPEGARDFRLEARIEAEVVQACAITLVPLSAQIGESVLRRYIAEWQHPEGEEIEMPDDESAEPMPEVIDIGLVAIEALELALPLFPRAPGAELGEITAAPPGLDPIEIAEIKPFASLAALKSRLEGKKEENEGGSGS